MWELMLQQLYLNFLIAMQAVEKGPGGSTVPVAEPGSAASQSAPQEPFFQRVTVWAWIAFVAASYNLFITDLVSDTIASLYDSTQQHVASVASASLVGACAGMFVLGLAADVIGRRAAFLVSCLLALDGVVGSAAVMAIDGNADAVWVQLAVARFFAGVGVGGLYPLCATLVTEGVEKVHRGRALVTVFMAQGAGRLLAALVPLAFLAGTQDLQVVWRGSLLFGALPLAAALYWRWSTPHESALFLAAVQTILPTDAATLAAVAVVPAAAAPTSPGSSQAHSMAVAPSIFSAESPMASQAFAQSQRLAGSGAGSFAGSGAGSFVTGIASESDRRGLVNAGSGSAADWQPLAPGFASASLAAGTGPGQASVIAAPGFGLRTTGGSTVSLAALVSASEQGRSEEARAQVRAGAPSLKRQQAAGAATVQLARSASAWAPGELSLVTIASPHALSAQPAAAPFAPSAAVAVAPAFETAVIPAASAAVAAAAATPSAAAGPVSPWPKTWAEARARVGIALSRLTSFKRTLVVTALTWCVVRYRTGQLLVRCMHSSLPTITCTSSSLLSADARCSSPSPSPSHIIKLLSAALPCAGSCWTCTSTAPRCTRRRCCASSASSSRVAAARL